MPDQDERTILDIPRPKGNGEVLRAALSMFKGQEYFSVRVWYKADDGQLKPGKNGVNLTRGEFAEFERLVGEIRKALTLTNQPAAEPANA